MQTFLPYDDFKKSAECLDKKRALKQVVETYQIINTLTGISEGWKNHPAVLMWKGYTFQLMNYYNEFYIHCRDNLKIKFNKLRMYKIELLLERNSGLPPWFGMAKFHDSHKSNLLRKDEVFYGKYGWVVPNNLDYFWPTKEGIM